MRFYQELKPDQVLPLTGLNRSTKLEPSFTLTGSLLLCVLVKLIWRRLGSLNS
jgi:hypothetical protein